MALNCSSRSLLLGDDGAGRMLGCGCWSEEASPLSSFGVNSLWWDEMELELEEGTEESDPVARLPSDPFEMNMQATSATITAAIANCIEDFTARSAGWPFGSGSNDDLIVDLLNYTFVFAPNPWVDGHVGVFEGPFWSGGPSGGDDRQSSWLPPNAPCSQPNGFAVSPSNSQNTSMVCCDADDAAPSRSAENPLSSHDAASMCCDAVGAASGQQGNDAHPGMFVALSYLGLRDLLSVEMVCKSLHSAVRSEYCSWKCIHIGPQLGAKISDVDLLRLTQKSPGVLQCLSLVHCKNITDQGLKAVLQSNPQLTKLGIFDNVRITHQGLVDNLISFNMEACIGIKKLRVANFATLSKVQYEELLSLLKIDKGLALHKQESRIFNADYFVRDHHGGYAPNIFLPDLHDEYALDIERCPLCDKYKYVYDCPAEGCNTNRTGTCRGCLVCILRCLRCGRCIDREHDVYEETYTRDSLCLRCHMDEVSDIAGTQD